MTINKVERVMTALELIFEGEAKFYSYCQQAVFQPLVISPEDIETENDLYYRRLFGNKEGEALIGKKLREKAFSTARWHMKIV